MSIPKPAKSTSRSVLHPDQRIPILETLPTHDIVEILVCEQIEAIRAAAKCTEEIAAAARLVVERGGRLICLGAGTSGRLAVMNMAECEPTFGTGEKFVGLMAGGSEALTRSVEGAEDDEKAACESIRNLNPKKDQDTICGLAASGTTPYVRAALKFARMKGIATIFVTGQPVPLDAADVIIHLDTGPEVIHGSTRMKAGTAQKVTLDALTTTINALRGRTYGGLMVGMVASNKKLNRREVAMLRRLTGLSEPNAKALLLKVRGPDPVMIATVMHHKNVDAARAARMLSEHEGSLRRVVGDVDYTKSMEDEA